MHNHEHCSCGLHTHKRATRIQTNAYDPTHTTSLRNRFARQMGARFRHIRGLIRKAIVDQDCFGLMNPDVQGSLNVLIEEGTLPGREAFNFRRSGEKVEAFAEWLQDQANLTVLEQRQIGRGVQSAWTNQYIESSYQKGLVRARQELRRAGYTSRAGDEVPALETRGEISAAFNQPIHMDRVGLVYSRTFTGLQGITQQMDTQISRVLAQGMADGLNPRILAKKLTRVISGPVGNLGITDTLDRFIPAERRARMLARTETIRAHHNATIQEYKNWGVEGVNVQAEWVTAGDGDVCEECEAMAIQGPYTLDEIERLIPYHPQCRCVALPILPGQ